MTRSMKLALVFAALLGGAATAAARPVVEASRGAQNAACQRCMQQQCGLVAQACVRPCQSLPAVEQTRCMDACMERWMLCARQCPACTHFQRPDPAELRRAERPR